MSDIQPPEYCLGCRRPIYDDRRGEWDWYCRQHSPTGIRCTNVAVLKTRCPRVAAWAERQEAWAAVRESQIAPREGAYND